MSKGFSGLFSGTEGAKRASAISPSIQEQKAFDYAKNIFVHGTRKEKERLNTVTIAVDEETGKTYYGVNGGIKLHKAPKNIILFGDETHEGLLPKQSLNSYSIGNCSEADAINKALNDGAKIRNLHITTLCVTKKNLKSGKKVAKCACANCTSSFKGKIKKNHTGWED